MQLPLQRATSPAGDLLPGERERALRQQLGIPQDAERVLVFSESSHWDTNWLRTSEEYFRHRLEPIFDAVMKALEKDPERVYAVESIFFLKLFWERHPEAQDRLRRLIERRQLRITASSLTTPDTLLPHPEAIIRDFHLGQEWLRANKLDVTPHTAYFPDNFGHSPHLPSLMRAVGVEAVALTRIDGMYFIAADYRSKGAFPLKGSTAELLQNELKTLDFVWQADDGAEILSHWNAFTYFQGDMLAHVGIIRWSGHTIGIPWRTGSHIARRIDGFVRQLEPLSRTPYLSCPIGMDFNDPIKDLRPLLERYNRERYESTGTWAVLAGLDDYFALVDTHRDSLPVLSVDPNPYWMGFYSSRPTLKQRPTRIARSLVLAEHLSALAPRDEALEAHLREAWTNLVLINHHDAITGTSPDHIWHGEQKPWLDAAEAAARHALSLASKHVKLETQVVAGESHGVRWSREGGLVRVHTTRHHLTFDEAKGGGLTSLMIDGEERLAGVGLDLVAYADHGGLWRLGHEFRGGRFDEVDSTSRRPAKMSVREDEDGISIISEGTLGGKKFTREVTVTGEEPLLQVRITGAAARRLTITCRSDLAVGPARLEMDTVGGVIERPHERLYKPTFWPVPSWMSLREPQRAMLVSFESPTAASFGPPSSLEWIVARNAPKERAFHILPVLAHPIGGTVDDVQTHEAALFAAPGGVVTTELRRKMERIWIADGHHQLRRHADSLVRVDDPSVSIAAAKRADVGSGIIVRLTRNLSEPSTVRVSIPSGPIESAMLCDARERDIAELEIQDGSALVPLSARMTSIRLVVPR